MNGRVNIQNQFDFFDKIPVQTTASAYSCATKGLQEQTDLSKKFFSAENIITIQNAIISNIKQITNYIIPPQNEDIIKNIMWHYYLEFSAHSMNNIEDQINSLNKKILEHCIPGIIESIKADMKYRYDISHMHVPLTRSIATTKKGLISNEFKRFF